MFDWVRKQVEDDNGRRVSHYLVDPGGRVRADIDEPTGRNLAFLVELYWTQEDKYSHWITLDMAKTHVELAYENHLQNEVKKHEVNQGPVEQSRAETSALAGGAQTPESAGTPAPVSADAAETPGTT